MAIKPWYKVVTPREDLREGKPLDAAEFAVHLDHVRSGNAEPVYTDPQQFFSRTFMTRGLSELAASTIRRLSGERMDTSAVFNMKTQFGGGKTHALTLLYHLAHLGPEANGLPGVRALLDRAGVKSVPEARVAVFVGTEFDDNIGRGGDDGTPRRTTPWGEIAFQLGGAEALAVLAEHEKKMVAPGGDAIRKFMPSEPCLILIDELMNFVSRWRRTGVPSQLYTFLHNLSEEARARNNIVLAISIPKSAHEMTAEDEEDFRRYEHMLDRLGKPVVMSAETETSEIIRRRLFEWDNAAVGQDGKVLLPREAIQTATEYAEWVLEHRQQLPEWFPVDFARDTFVATYPFHPSVLSVFERKWQVLPRFQRTRGVLKMLARWVARAYDDGYKGAHRDALIGLGAAPLDLEGFRAAIFEQLGEQRLEGAVTADICGKKDSFATRLDAEAVDTIKKARLHRKVATTIFFESNGGQARAEATIPEIRLAVGEPGLDIGNVETALDALESTCFFLSMEKNRYRFSLVPNLNRLLSDRRASIAKDAIDVRLRDEVLKAFTGKSSPKPVPFPDKSNQIPDRAALTFVVMPPERPMTDEGTLATVEAWTKECGTSGRTFKSALIWCVPESATAMTNDARSALAWEAIQAEDSGRLDDGQKQQLTENIGKARRNLREAVWRAYKNVVLLGKDNELRTVDLGLVHSSAASDITQLVLSRLTQEGDVSDSVGAAYLVRNWPPALEEWSTKGVRDAFFASPKLSRLLDADAIKDTIARGVAAGQLAFVGKDGGEYEPFLYKSDLRAADVEISDDVFIIKKETAEAYKVAKAVPPPAPASEAAGDGTAAVGTAPASRLFTAPSVEGAETETAAAPPGISTIRWSGDVPSQKWMNFYKNILSKFAVGGGLKVTVHFEISPDGGVSAEKTEETRTALRELGLSDKIDTQ
jgi:hypothetical protein